MTRPCCWCDESAERRKRASREVRGAAGTRQCAPLDSYRDGSFGFFGRGSSSRFGGTKLGRMRDGSADGAVEVGTRMGGDHGLGWYVDHR